MATEEFLNKPFSIYCRQSLILGLDEEKDIAEKILAANKQANPAILIFAIADTGYLYGQCTFERELGDDVNFKFSDTFEHIKDTRALQILIEEHGVKTILFTEQGVFNMFNNEPTLTSYVQKFKLISK